MGMAEKHSMAFSRSYNDMVNGKCSWLRDTHCRVQHRLHSSLPVDGEKHQ